MDKLSCPCPTVLPLLLKKIALFGHKGRMLFETEERRGNEHTADAHYWKKKKREMEEGSKKDLI